ncbi:hypothetical protein DL770_007388 [Monosporascus sp. CRB-9-2]|nr:hypothetical protein DL770_007388 [Monosporascus sp. CRB-9-2]
MTVTVPAVDPMQSQSQSASQSQSTFFHRSHSSSDSLSAVPRRLSSSPAPPPSSHGRPPSSQSLPTSPGFDLPSFDFESEISSGLSLSTDDLRSDFGADEKTTTVRSDQVSPTSKWRPASEQRAEKMDNGKSPLSIPLIRTPVSDTPSSEERPSGSPVEDAAALGSRNDQDNEASKFLEPTPRRKSRMVADSFTSFARRSWMATSRSPPPGDRKEEPEDAPDARARRERSGSLSTALSRKMTRRQTNTTVDGAEEKAADSRGKLGSYLTKIKQKPQAALAKAKNSSGLASSASSSSSLAPGSVDTRLSHASEKSTRAPPDDVAAAPKIPRARDPLWSLFKDLESDYGKFRSKSGPARMTIVRSALLPFLKNTASHTSTKLLRHEDLERRAVILNKWWSGMLEMLDGKNECSVAGADRPTLIEVVTLVMMRPEWRQGTPTFTPFSDRGPREREKTRARVGTNASSSDGSIGSTDSEYFAESAAHNVRTMFANNLITQMGIVVDKLSLRHAPLALVNFAGKTCAYAFFFAPGMADVLVGLWALKADAIRRVADEFRLPRLGKREGGGEVVGLFPPNLAGLAWSSMKTITSTLRQTPKPPVAAAKVPWRGPWVSRWRGRETDLFFIFCKYYYILAEEFMPPELPLVEKAWAPGFVLVNAQILSVLDSTLRREQSAQPGLGPALADAATGVDALAMPLPLAAANNALKGMNDNRLIVLLKDILSSASIRLSDARHTFAEAFMLSMKASAKRISQYDHSACFLLCDFLEEALPAFDNFVDERRPGLNYVDWPFWLQAWQRVLESNHSMSEIRILSLLFSLWDAIASDPARKEQFCAGWLLTPEIFSKFFTNWCPMVRAYYMRLLCWRICRDTGNADDSDAIFLLVSSRLKTTWSHYLWLKQDAEKKGRFPPSTAPSYPAPGKRFMIIRTEAPAPQPGLVVGFDHFMNTVAQPETTGSPASVFDALDSLDSPASESKKKWGILGRVLSLTGNSTPVNGLDAARRDTAMSRIKPTPPPKSPTSTVTPPASDTDSMGSATFETLRYVFKFVLSWNTLGTTAPPNRILTRPRLPAPAQSWVSSRDPNGAPPPPPAGPPAPTRAFSGSARAGLVHSARNADPADVSPTPYRISMSFDSGDGFDPLSPVDRSSFDQQASANAVTPTQEPITRPVEPEGASAAAVKYAGRALAEWGLVVGECNGFIDRRRDEGVLGLGDVEVPTLGVEGIRKSG